MIENLIEKLILDRIELFECGLDVGAVYVRGEMQGFGQANRGAGPMSNSAFFRRLCFLRD